LRADRRRPGAAGRVSLGRPRWLGSAALRAAAGTAIVDDQGATPGLRFVDIDEDGRADVVFSNADRYSLHLFTSMDDGWGRKVVGGPREEGGRIPMIVRADGTNNGAWFKFRHMWVQNEQTGARYHAQPNGKPLVRMSFSETIPGLEADPEIDYFGVPFYASAYPRGSMPAPGRNSAPIGWLETNVVQFSDPGHIWHDPQGKTFHLWMRAHTGGTGLAAVAKVVEDSDGRLVTSLEQVPSGKTALYVPCPGGQMRFHVVYDEPTQLFWLLSSQATDSMTRADLLPASRYNLPNNERHRLQLHFSRNMVDWCFAGLVAVGDTPSQARHYASMVIDGQNLCVLSRSGDSRAKSAHDGNLITFHTVKNFRRLVY
jgi:hypothetical protein